MLFKRAKKVKPVSTEAGSDAYTCKNCDFLMEDHTIYNPKEYLAILADMQGYINQGNFVLVEQTCNFDEVLKKTWYSDCIEHVIQCKTCGSQFVCYADTYHGVGRFYKKDNSLNR